jgi:hypothetical protein
MGSATHLGARCTRDVNKLKDLNEDVAAVQRSFQKTLDQQLFRGRLHLYRRKFRRRRSSRIGRQVCARGGVALRGCIAAYTQGKRAMHLQVGRRKICYVQTGGHAHHWRSRPTKVAAWRAAMYSPAVMVASQGTPLRSSRCRSSAITQLAALRSTKRRTRRDVGAERGIELGIWEGLAEVGDAVALFRGTALGRDDCTLTQSAPIEAD